MLLKRPIQFRKRRANLMRVPPRSQPTPPVVGPVLVSATYEQGSAVELTFDRAVDADGFDPASFRLFDGPVGFEYEPSDVSVLSPTVVRVGIIGVQEWVGVGVTMNVTGANGIVAQDGGEAWAGVTDLALPFP